MKVNIKNYSSSVAVETSMGRIERCLVNAGARAIMKDYSTNGQCAAISFSLPLNGGTLAFKIPARVDNIYSAMVKEYVRPTAKSFQTCLSQAERTAWKIISDWVEIQVTMILLDQADLMQVFMPYLHDGKSSLYEKMKDSNFKLLK